MQVEHIHFSRDILSRCIYIHDLKRPNVIIAVSFRAILAVSI